MLGPKRPAKTKVSPHENDQIVSAQSSGNYQHFHPPARPHGAWEYHENLLMKTDKKPLRIWMQVGEKDNGWDRPVPPSYHNWVEANERMAAVLAKKGYAYQYVFCKKAGHVDGKAVAATLPAAGGNAAN